MMQKLLTLLTLLTLYLIFPFTVYSVSFDVTSEYIYFYQLDKDELLYEKNKDIEISIASMTKIMTALIAIENIDDLDEIVNLTDNDFKGLIEANASTAGFYTGEKVTYRDLLYGLMLPSGADAALALSNNISGSEESFVVLMNNKVEELGLSHTKFVNTTGLDQEGHYSSVEDVAIFLLVALENPIFYEIFTTKNYTTSNNRLTFKNTILKNSDTFNIDANYIKGSKSGYTYDAGLCLASIATYNDNVYLLITAGADYKSGKPNHLLDSNQIYNFFFNNYSYQNILTEGELIISLIDENNEYNNYYVPYTKERYLSNESEITTKYIGVDLITYDMNIGDKLGVYEVYVDGKLVESIDVLLENKIVKVGSINYVILAFIVLFFIVILFSIKKSRINKENKKYFI